MDAFSPDQLLRRLTQFLTETKPLLENMDCLMTFAPQDCPIVEVAIAKLEHSEDLEGYAVWRADPAEQTAAEKYFLDVALPAALTELRGRTFRDTEIIRLQTPQKDQQPELLYLVYPLWMEGHLDGLLFIGKTAQTGDWTDEMEERLRPFQILVKQVTSNRRLLRDYTLQSWVFNEIMDNMNANIYITDVETDKILFMNKTMKKTFGLEHPEEKICWKVLQNGMTTRCAFCPVHKLLESQEAIPSIVWEETNSLSGRIYENYDSLMQWTDGRVVHFQRSLDITDRKQLTQAANYDELTGLLNRRAGLENLKNLVKQASAAGEAVTVIMLDIDGLKTINDTYGHIEGDRLLAETAKVIKENLKAEDCAFRLSGDEFILVMGTKEKIAAERMTFMAQELRSRSRTLELSYEITFCYGLMEVAPDENIPLHDLLSGVDEKMYLQKRRHHIELAELQRQQAIQSDVIQQFDYDKSKLYDALIKSTDDYIYVCNMRTGTFRYPPAMVEEFDLPSEVIENAAAVWGAKVHERDRQTFLESNQEITDGRTDCHNVEYRALNRHGEWVWLRCRGHLERDEKGDPILFAGMITNLGRRNKIDHLTGLLNKFAFEAELQRLLDTSPDQPLGLLILGIDEFRHINDLYDRLFGDEVIRTISQKLQSMLPAIASLYRLDGDEFGVIFRGGSRDAVRTFYSAVQDTFSYQQVCEDKKYYCTLSGGCVFSPEDGSGYLELIKRANYSMEYAKSKGKNRMFFFSNEILQHKERSLELTELLRESIDRGFDGFELYFQPQVFTADGKLKGAEALCRWSCEKYGAVSPVEFIPLLEESGLILPAGRWIFEEAVRICARWLTAVSSFTISVNLSCLQMEDDNFLDFMEMTLQKYQVSPARIEVELTESYIASNMDALAESFNRIRQMGMSIAMDDFGTGYSSLGILKLAPADVVKIDRTFVRDILSSSFDATFIRFIVELCHDVGIRVCLEGVETEAEYIAVRSMQPDYIQGFYFGRPLSAEKFVRLFLSGERRPEAE